MTIIIIIIWNTEHISRTSIFRMVQPSSMLSTALSLLFLYFVSLYCLSVCEEFYIDTTFCKLWALSNDEQWIKWEFQKWQALLGEWWRWLWRWYNCNFEYIDRLSTFSWLFWKLWIQICRIWMAKRPWNVHTAPSSKFPIRSVPICVCRCDCVGLYNNSLKVFLENV